MPEIKLILNEKEGKKIKSIRNRIAVFRCSSWSCWMSLDSNLQRTEVDLRKKNGRHKWNEV